MKKYKEVESTRQEYHKDPNINSVHRSSLIVPEILGTEVDISFLNHFLLKRNYSKVACKITPIDNYGQKIESRLYTIDKPIVYKIPLTGMVDKPVSSYLVEFFAADNLFIPFPAVMINHKGKGFINQVHSYNRVLNDVFEDDVINSTQVSEASIDLILENNTDTFLLFSAGPTHIRGPLEIEILTDKEKTLRRIHNVDLVRFGTKKISMRETFKDIPNGVKGVLKVKQPRQFLFYGRMLGGQYLNDGAFSANHSYYDSSTVPDYWDDNKSSQRFYPFFCGLNNIIRMYPIMSPSNLNLSIGLYATDGSLLKEVPIGVLTSPGNHYLNVLINSVAKQENIDSKQICSFSVSARTTTNGKMPTRVNHQLIYGNGGLNTSINISLNNPNVFVPKDKKSFKWGQTIVGRDYDTFVGIVADPSENVNIKYHDVIVKFYGSEGEIAQRNWHIPNGSSINFEVGKELLMELEKLKINTPQYIWCTVESENYGINYVTTTYNKITKHCSGEHGF